MTDAFRKPGSEFLLLARGLLGRIPVMKGLEVLDYSASVAIKFCDFSGKIRR